MNRRDFLRACAALSASLPMFRMLGGCSSAGGLYQDLPVSFDGDVLVIGAGAAGLAAGFLLDRYGIPFTTLEASDRIGGRVRLLDGFADFPIDAGAEWIHEHPSVLASLIDDPSVRASIDVVPYSPDSVSVGGENRVTRANLGGNY